MPGALVQSLDVDLTVPVLVPVALLLYDVELDVGGGARRAFQSICAWVPRLVAVALRSDCRAMRRSRYVSTVASTTNHTQTTCGRLSGSVAASLVMVSAMAPSSPCEGAP